MFDLEISGYVLPWRPPTQTHQRWIGFHGAAKRGGVSVPCYFKLFGFFRWVNKFGLNRRKKKKNNKNSTRLIFHLFCERHLSLGKIENVFTLQWVSVSAPFESYVANKGCHQTLYVITANRRVGSGMRSENSGYHKKIPCYFYGRRAARSASFSEGVYSCVLLSLWQCSYWC